MRRFLVLPILLILSACATNGSLSAGEKAALREVAAIGVERYVRENADSAKVQKIRAALVELQQLPDITTVDGLRALVQSRIDAKVSDPLDRRDLTRLVNVLAPLLEDYVGSGQLAPDAVVEVRDFLAYIAAALPCDQCAELRGMNQYSAPNMISHVSTTPMMIATAIRQPSLSRWVLGGR